MAGVSGCSRRVALHGLEMGAFVSHAGMPVVGDARVMWACLGPAAGVVYSGIIVARRLCRVKSPYHLPGNGYRMFGWLKRAPPPPTEQQRQVAQALADYPPYAPPA